MADEIMEPGSLSGGEQSDSAEMNDEVEIQHRPCPYGHSMWAQGLSQELLLKIFSMVVDEEGAIPFLCRASSVCRSWSSAASDSKLWREVDFTGQCRIIPVGGTLRWLVDNGLSNVIKLNLSWWVALTPEDYMHLFDSCRQLQTLDLSYCKLTPKVIKALGSLPNLQSVNLSAMPDAVRQVPAMLCSMLRSMGPRLRELNLSNNRIKSYAAIMNALMDNCPNLTLLDLSWCTFSSSQSSLNIEKLQSCCPQLRVLRLQNTRLPAVRADEEAMVASDGFPELEQLNVAVSGMFRGNSSFLAYNDNFITRMLRNSPNLLDLDVSMCFNVSDNSLLKIPSERLKKLRVSSCSETAEYRGIVKIIDKWKDSLENVDLSWNQYPRGSLDRALYLMSKHGTPLRSLNIAGTTVSKKAIRTLLMCCRQLTTLDLTCVYSIGLPHSAIGLHKGRKTLNELMKTLS